MLPDNNYFSEIINLITNATQMKLLIYYLLIILPIPLLIMMRQLDLDYTFIIGILVYAGIYRPIINANRLIEMGIISKEEKYKLFIPFNSRKYMYYLYFMG